MSDDLSSTIESWRVAGIVLGFRVQSPYHAVTANGQEVLCVAHLPDFGSPNGMVIGAIIGPTFETDNAVKRVADEMGKYCSFINIRLYAKYEEAVFKEALADWGYWGVDVSCPQWLQNPK